ncbi:MAG: iron-sulfur cluster assembly scaffold protein [Chlamydiales bacterium]|nr:iron-sulfur cluster assembly scaffold protein [Chlamydiales bacterium]
MSLNALTMSFPWARYSKALKARIDKPRNAGFFYPEESVARGVRLVEGIDGGVEDGNEVHLYWLVDLEDGIIVDAKFQVFGQSALIGAADVACDILVGKNYDQAQRMTADLIDKHVRDKPDQAAFPPETFSHLNLVLSAIVDAGEQCQDIPVAEGYVAPPMPTGQGSLFEGDGYPGWDELPHDQKLAVIEQVMNDDIRPYIALDAGGVDIVELNDKRELTVAYKGSCTSCYSSVGATLSAIQGILRAKVHKEMVVIPDFDEAPTGMPPGMH